MAAKLEDKKLIVAPKKLWEKVDRQARKEDRSRSYIVRKAIELYLSQPQPAMSGS